MSANIYIDKRTQVLTACPESTMKIIAEFTGEDLHYGFGYFTEEDLPKFKTMYLKNKNYKDLCNYNPFKQMYLQLQKRKTIYMRCVY